LRFVVPIKITLSKEKKQHGVLSWMSLQQLNGLEVHPEIPLVAQKKF
jgi:hypothetical protein